MRRKAWYFVDEFPQENGDHEVHRFRCEHMPPPSARIYVGECYTCRDALRMARQHRRQVNGCRYCSKACHTS